jgi:hypothetical protein
MKWVAFITIVVAHALSTTRAWPQPTTPPEPPMEGVVRAEAPIVEGNAVTAKKRALADAFRQVVERALDELLKEGAPMPSPAPAGLTQLRASFASSAQRFVRSYRLIEQDSAGGMMRIMVDADVDTVALRREVDRIRGSASVPATAPTAPRPTSDLVLVAGPAPAGASLVAALGATGVKSSLVAVAGEPQLVASAVQQGATAVFVTATSAREGMVRGTPKLSVKCSLRLRVFKTGVNAPPRAALDRTDDERGFAVDENAAREACFVRAASMSARMIVAALRTPMVSAPFVTVQLDIVSPGVIPILLQGLKHMGLVAGSEVRQIASRSAEIRVFTRAGGATLLQSLTHEVSGKLTVTPTQTSNDLLALTVRSVDAQPTEAN